jgi:hypothetical protein
MKEAKRNLEEGENFTGQEYKIISKIKRRITNA